MGLLPGRAVIPRALSIAGSDPGGGAGIQQDLKTFHALGAWGMTAITAVTVQNTLGVTGWHRVPPDVVAAQIEAVATDIGVDAAKTGMLPDAAIIESVARAVADAGIERLVVDPVMVATSGDALVDDDAVEALRRLLLPRAMLITPNAREAERLTGLDVTDRAGQWDAGRALLAEGCRAVMLKGGHVPGEVSVDVLITADGAELELEAPRLDTPHTHGSGCMLSASITALLAAGAGLADACRSAKEMVTGAIRHGLAIGGGAGPVNPGWRDPGPSRRSAHPTG